MLKNETNSSSKNKVLSLQQLSQVNGGIGPDQNNAWSTQSANCQTVGDNEWSTQSAGCRTQQ